MEIDDLQELAQSIGLKNKPVDLLNNPLSTDEIYNLMHFCRTQLCNGDLKQDLKMFYSSVYDILRTSILEKLN